MSDQQQPSSEQTPQTNAAGGETAPSAESMAETSPQSFLQLSDWLAAVVVAGVISWLLYSFPVYTWRVPDRLADVSAMSPQAEQDELAAVELSNLWKNTLLRFTSAGIGWGLAGLVLFRRKLRAHRLAVVTSLIAGILCGAGAGVVGLLVRRYLDLDYPIPLVSAENRPMIADSIVFAVTTVILLLPLSVLAIMQPAGGSYGAIWAAPVAAIVASLVAPLILAAGFPHEKTSVFPPRSLTVISVWYGATIVLTSALIVRTVKSPARRSSTAAPTASSEQ